MVTAAQARHANYACGGLSLIILFARLVVSRRTKRPIDVSFVLVVLSIILVIARLVLVYFVLRYGTASDAVNKATYFDSHSATDVKAGTILSLMTRILITAASWLQICLLLLFYTQIMHGIQWIDRAIKVTWFCIGATFAAVVLATFLECRPFHLYWQVTPDPGTCVRSYIQLCVLSGTNVLLDLLLLVISWPILFCKGRTWIQRLRIGLLFILGTFCIIVTTLRLIYVYAEESNQVTRSLWASVQMVVSTFVANAPTIYGDLQLKSRKKSEARVRRESRPEEWRPFDLKTATGLSLSKRSELQETPGSSRKEWFDHIEEFECAAKTVKETL